MLASSGGGMPPTPATLTSDAAEHRVQVVVGGAFAAPPRAKPVMQDLVVLEVRGLQPHVHAVRERDDRDAERRISRVPVM